jgi:hypothetical protein
MHYLSVSKISIAFSWTSHLIPSHPISSHPFLHVKCMHASMSDLYPCSILHYRTLHASTIAIVLHVVLCHVVAWYGTMEQCIHGDLCQSSINFTALSTSGTDLELFWCSDHELLLCGSTLGLAFRQALCSGLTLNFWLCTFIHAFAETCLIFWVSLCSFNCRISFFGGKSWVWRSGCCENSGCC